MTTGRIRVDEGRKDGLDLHPTIEEVNDDNEEESMMQTTRTYTARRDIVTRYKMVSRWDRIRLCASSAMVGYWVGHFIERSVHLSSFVRFATVMALYFAL